jgi:hypothetical protein
MKHEMILLDADLRTVYARLSKKAQTEQKNHDWVPASANESEPNEVPASASESVDR